MKNVEEFEITLELYSPFLQAPRGLGTTLTHTTSLTCSLGHLNHIKNFITF
jgi:hypothetical protein